MTEWQDAKEIFTELKATKARVAGDSSKHNVESLAYWQEVWNLTKARLVPTLTEDGSESVANF